MKPKFWAGRRVLVTGHTGFKGAWLALWLRQMGARVSGLSIGPLEEPNLWSLLGLADVSSHMVDVRNPDAVRRVMAQEQPEVLMHLAAQSLVRQSYADPLETFSTNIMGTAVLLSEIARQSSVRACVVVTSDKCYDNREISERYDENDPLGGRDPYSASKACAEIVTASMRDSFFSPAASGASGRSDCRIAAARAGNVIGGGDWAADRLVPDIVRGSLGPRGLVEIRAPHSVRPWQHVLEPLRGYLMLAERLTADSKDVSEAWNFGPDAGQECTVQELANALVKHLGVGRVEARNDAGAPHEANILRLNSAKARKLGWAPLLDLDTTLKMTARWYRAWADGADPTQLCTADIEEYQRLANGV